ncbi:hypothetical protein [Nocardioides baekrokdamisoli]|uniref:hypothetical protein n=1 Tax=Nocardioides baekrokdamisoli TaxID=1804624 RepID=UPI0013DDE5AC|nr:hypothetical protein [Nocardioides baekrokdamisoli]
MTGITRVLGHTDGMPSVPLVEALSVADALGRITVLLELIRKLLGLPSAEQRAVC